MKARITETIPPIRNLKAMILNPSPSCIGETVPIQIQITPKAIPAARSGNNMVFWLTESDIAI